MIVLVGHVVVRGSIRAVKKKLKVRAEQKAQLEQLNLTETSARSATGHFTVRFVLFVLLTCCVARVKGRAWTASALQKNCFQ